MTMRYDTRIYYKMFIYESFYKHILGLVRTPAMFALGAFCMWFSVFPTHKLVKRLVCSYKVIVCLHGKCYLFALFIANFAKAVRNLGSAYFGTPHNANEHKRAVQCGLHKAKFAVKVNEHQDGFIGRRERFMYTPYKHL